MQNIRRSCASLAALATLLMASAGFSAEPTVDFHRDVFPILQAHCVGCHTADDASGGLNMESFEGLVEGGEHGPAFTAGVPDSSRLYRMVTGTVQPVMPPEGETPLSEEQLTILKTWIEEGAVGPSGDAPPRRLKTPDIPPAPAEQHPVTAVAISADGQRVALARFGRIEVRNADCSEVLHTIQHDEGKVNAVSFDRSGERLLTAGGVTGLRGRAVIYEIATGQALDAFGGDGDRQHRDVLYTAVFSPDESKVATAGYDRSIVVWDVKTGEPLVTMDGHNGAVYQIAFSPDGRLLASASADETVKVWSIESGQRLDTLPQPQGEVLDVCFTADGQQIVAAGADSRFRVWKVVSRETPQINPLLVTRFADESPLTRLAFTPDAKRLLVVSQAGNIKTFDASTWQPTATLAALGEAASDMCVFPGGETVLVALMNGEISRQSLPSTPQTAGEPASVATEAVDPVYVQLDLPQPINEADYRKQAAEAPLAVESAATDAIFVGQAVGTGRRGFTIDGTISSTASGDGEVDWYALEVEAGEVWVVETEAAANGSPLDTVVEVCDPATGKPLSFARLQAVRESYFTFRGKDSTQSNDFRLFGWEEMELDDYLYAAGEVTKLSMYPRGPDSGFNVYPGSGNRWTYFNTSPVTHALGEPAYIVRPLQPGEQPVANGLPIFDVPMMNDDDPLQQRGTDSRLIFTPSISSTLLVNLRDARGAGGDDFRYRLTARPARPDFVPSVQPIAKPIPLGGGRELTVRAGRIDGFDGPIRFDISGVPDGMHVSSPVWIQAGQNEAAAVVWADEDAKPADGAEAVRLRVTATAMIAGRKVQHTVDQPGTVQWGEQPPLRVVVQPPDRNVQPNEAWTLQIRPGETVRARVQVVRNGHEGEVSLGNETAGRNAHHGVFVDNIGLNGLLIVEGSNEREFFLTAAPIAEAGKRSFFLKANVDGGVASQPITLEVVE